MKHPIWLVSDSHFNHRMLIEKKFRLVDFDRKILENLSKLDKNSVLIHLGDVCMGQDSLFHSMIKKMKFYKTILVKGNHDSKSYNWYGDYWDFVCEKFYWNLYGKRLCFSHRPQVIDDTFDINIHGHFHTKEGSHRYPEYVKILDEKTHLLISLDDSNYQPLNLMHTINNFIK